MPDELGIAERAGRLPVHDDIGDHDDLGPVGVEGLAAAPRRRHVQLAEAARERGESVVIERLAPETHHQMLVPGVLYPAKIDIADIPPEIDPDDVRPERAACRHHANVRNRCPGHVRLPILPQ